MQHVSLVALSHPDLADVYLHGLRRDSSKFALPGGHAKPGETAQEAAHRELHEETGFDIKDLKQVSTEHHPSHADPEGVMLSLFVGQWPGGEPSNHADPDQEFKGFKFLSPTDHPDMHVPSGQNVLVHWLNREQGLSKGVMSRIAPYNPIHDEDTDFEAVRDWQDQDASRDILDTHEMEQNAKKRAIHRLFANSHWRRNPTSGQIEFLMHRAMSRDEFGERALHSRVHERKKQPSYLHYDENSSWSPNPGVAVDLMRNKPEDYHTRKSVWVPKNKIQVVPMQYGSLGTQIQEGPGQNEYANEHEVIVNPGKFKLASPFYVANIGKIKSIHDRINTGWMGPEDALSGHPEYSRPRIKAAQKLRKDAPLYYEPDWALWNDPPGFVSENSQHIKTELLPNGLYHHVFHKGKRLAGGAYAHTISQFKNPQKPDLAGLSGEKDDQGALHINYATVTQGNAGKGYGKQAYAAALLHHGKIISDELVSDPADRAWDHIRNQKGIMGKRGNFGDPSSHHEASVISHAMIDRKSLFPAIKPAFVMVGQKLGKSENLAKEDWENTGNPHGWVAPSGKFYPMDSNENHIEALTNHLGGNAPMSENLSQDAIDDAYRNGWISVGHTGASNFAVHNNIAKNPNHPAMMTLRNLFNNSPSDAVTVDVLTDRGHMVINRTLDARKFSKYGNLGKSEGPLELIHYSPTKGIREIDPSKHGERGIGAEYRRGLPEHKISFYYRAGTKPEDLVMTGAKSKYKVTLSPEQRLYNIAEDPEGIVERAVFENHNIRNSDLVHGAIKEAGYAGFHNPESHLPNAVGLYHKQPVIEERPLDTSDFGKSEDIHKHVFKDNKGTKLHGWISPEGEYYHLGDREGHSDWMYERLSGRRASDDNRDDIRGAQGQAYDEGWVSVGHTGGHNAQGPALLNSYHPATLSLRRLISERAPEKEELKIYPRTSRDSTIEYRINSNAFARKGHFIDNFTGQAIHKSEGFPTLPHSFSFISAQHDKFHNQEAHTALENDLKLYGFKPQEVMGRYGYPEKSFLVAHTGNEKEKALIESLAGKYGQQSVLHSSGLKNQLIDPSSKKILDEGEGMEHGDHFQDMYTILPSGHKIQLGLGNLGKAAPLAKEQWGAQEEGAKLNPIHGWISPGGIYHHMGPDEVHDDVIKRLNPTPNDLPFSKFAEKYGPLANQRFEENRVFAQRNAANAGWLKVGQSGAAAVEGHSKFLTSRTHPATKKLRDMIAHANSVRGTTDHWQNEMEVHHTDKTPVTGGEQHPKYPNLGVIDANHFARHGTYRPFGRIFDLGKADIYDFKTGAKAQPPRQNLNVQLNYQPGLDHIEFTSEHEQPITDDSFTPLPDSLLNSKNGMTKATLEHIRRHVDYSSDVIDRADPNRDGDVMAYHENYLQRIQDRLKNSMVHRGFSKAEPGKAPHKHHTIPVSENIDWHLRHLWETPGSPGGYRTIRELTPKQHTEHHKQHPTGSMAKPRSKATAYLRSLQGRNRAQKP